MQSQILKRIFSRFILLLLILSFVNIFPKTKIAHAAPPAYVQANYSESSGNSASASFNNPVTAGNLLVVILRNGGNVTGNCTSGGRTFTLDRHEGPILGDWTHDVLSLPNATGGNTSVSCNTGGSVDQIRMSILEFSGVATSSPRMTVVSDEGGGVTNAGPISTSISNALILVSGASDSDEYHTVPNPGSGYSLVNLWAQFSSNNAPDKTAQQWRVAPNPGNYNTGFNSVSANPYSAIAVAYAPASSSPPPTPTPPPPPPSDTTPPTISSVTISNITTTGATITWTTNESSNSSVQYGLSTSYGSNQSSAGTTSHSVTLSSLSSNTTYNFRISATDPSGNNSLSGNQTFITQSVVTPPPPTPTPPPPPTPVTFTLSVSQSGTGTGTVSGTGINCGSDCSEVVNTGTSLTLSAMPTSGSTFVGWSGACSGTGSCTVIISSNATVTATFNLIPVTPPPPPSGNNTYYIATNGADTNPGTEALPWRNISKANSTLVAGDTVYIKAGTYTTRIAPVNSGNSTNRITYSNFGSDVVTISGTTHAIFLSGKSYITVQGLTATNLPQFLYITNNSNNNIIAFNNFNQQNPPDWEVSVIHNSQFNWVHHNTFSKGGACQGGSDDGSVLDIGIENSSSDNTRFNLIEDNVFFHGGHHVIGLHGRNNTIRNNYLHNEAWSNSRGNRNLYINGIGAVTGFNLIEGNRFGFSARPCDADTVGNVSMSTQNNIFRYNKLYHSLAYHLGTYSYSGYSNATQNKIYNNTFFNSGVNIPAAYNNGSEDTAITFQHSSNTNNALKNNLYYSNFQLYTGPSSQTFSNEFNGNTQGNPQFVNASTIPPTDTSDSSVPNLDLQSTSPAINAGGALTTVATADNGSGTSLVVVDAGYFQDGTFGPAGRIQADWIAVGSISNIVQISSISGNTITLANSITRQDNDSIWLYKKSDGVQVLFGTAPDAGAFEFNTGITPPPTPTPPPPTPTPTPVPVVGDINLDHVVNSLDWSIMNINWFGTNTGADLNHDGSVNSLDFALLSSNWLRTW